MSRQKEGTNYFKDLSYQKMVIIEVNLIFFGTVSPLSKFSIIPPLFLQKTKPLNPHLKYLFGIGI